MKDTIRPTNEVVGDEAAPVPGEQPAWRRTMMLRVKGRLGDIIGQLTAAIGLSWKMASSVTHPRCLM